MEGCGFFHPYHACNEGSIIREVAALLPSMAGEGIADAVSEITAHLLPFVSCGQYKYWNKILHALARHPWPHFLEGLSTKSPLLLSLVGVLIGQAGVRIEYCRSYLASGYKGVILPISSQCSIKLSLPQPWQ